jgi:hypothetical protein
MSADVRARTTLHTHVSAILHQEARELVYALLLKAQIPRNFRVENIGFVRHVTILHIQNLPAAKLRVLIQLAGAWRVNTLYMLQYVSIKIAHRS